MKKRTSSAYGTELAHAGARLILAPEIDHRFSHLSQMDTLKEFPRPGRLTNHSCASHLLIVDELGSTGVQRLRRRSALSSGSSKLYERARPHHHQSQLQRMGTVFGYAKKTAVLLDRPTKARNDSFRFTTSIEAAARNKMETNHALTQPRRAKHNSKFGQL